ncbi:hypothetical protein SELMODRAFT_402666 [Selaginella moellendorffii]|uniref:RING-type E3 ubiquitin transferase n=1 Tax=Selaginella moellendorffii TaxID=88036 RepID=D8QMN1_SELML|nr:hypothetical protein SELMODRAFT_402666 [Selaginella moellendorffii]
MRSSIKSSLAHLDVKPDNIYICNRIYKIRPETVLLSSTDGNGHNLPKSPFASPHHSKSSSNSHIPEEHHDQPPSLSTEEKMMGLDLNEVFNLAPPHNDIICCICLKHYVEPSKLDRSHTFCMQCILKVIKGPKDECPICRQHIDSQVLSALHILMLQILCLFQYNALHLEE